MKVWVYPEKTYEELGAQRWEVEWHTVKHAALKRIADAEAAGREDEVDPDADIVTHSCAYPLRAKGLAIARAKRMAVAKDSAYGCATVTRQVVDWYVEEDKIAEWTNADEPIYLP
jgi:hypothetical protein